MQRAGTGSGRGSGMATGSASAVGALNIIAAAIPSAADVTVSAFASKSILTDAPFPVPPEPVLLGASVWPTKLLHLWLL